MATEERNVRTFTRRRPKVTQEPPVLVGTGASAGGLDAFKKNPAEMDELSEDIFIHVTGFFREPDSFEALRTKVFPNLVSPGAAGKIRVWCPGCSSGEEMYSIAISMLEYLGTDTPSSRIQLFGTDISPAAIDVARAGSYRESIKNDVSRERLSRFFVRTHIGYQISKTVRDMCVFATHDLAKDPPFSKMDLISCRGMLICSSAPLQKRVLSLFHYALNPKGFLLLRTSESIQANSDLFTQIDGRYKIYTSKSKAGRHITATLLPAPATAGAASRAKVADRRNTVALKRELAEARDRLRATIDGQEATYEKLRAANGETLSSKEELHTVLDVRQLRILLADNHEIIRQGIRALLEQQPGWKVVGEAADAIQTLRLLKELQPDVLLMDVFTTLGGSGLDILQQIRKSWPSLEIVVFTMVETGHGAGALLSSGARSMVLKSDTTVDLVQAVEAASLGKMYLSSAVAQLLVSEQAPDRLLSKLTEREVEILRLLAEGKNSKEVAAALDLSSKTVDAYRARIMNKLTLNSLSDLIRFAIRHKMTSV
jgi:chemotaxis methyl-accepting protein methylase/DNA-binding NarL/FixJ family response regulator